MNSPDFILLQISLEYELDAESLLVPFNNSSEQAYYVVYQYASGFLPYYNHELPAEVRTQLDSLGVQAAFTHPEEVRQLISYSYLPCKGGEDIFWSGHFPRLPELGEQPELCHNGDAWSIMPGELEVSRAISVRQNERCAEVYVETLPAYRRKGYARQVVAAWVRDIMDRGRVAFYSYKTRNIASAALARSLGVEWYADVIAFEPI
jgi:GNAT superfamily N-acetyltransferase